MINFTEARQFELNCNGQRLLLSSPQVMGIINLDPNSFCRVGKYESLDPLLQHVKQMIDDGAAIVDIGGEATNPKLANFATSEQEELDRVIPIIENIRVRFQIPISIDTSRAKVMSEAVKAGAGFINDIRALRAPGALAMAAKLAVPVCLMHMSYPDGLPNPLPLNTEQPIVPMIVQLLQERYQAALSAGIKTENIVLDPGFGGGAFGKTTQQNLQLLNHLNVLQQFDRPILIGLSRKLFIGDILQQDANQRLYGSITAAILGALQGVSLIRVHDVKATTDALRVLQAFINSCG